MRREIAEGRHSPPAFRRWLERFSTSDQDRVVDELFELDPFVADAPSLPPGTVPYIAAPVSALLRLVTLLERTLSRDAASDVSLKNLTLVDIGSGVGRAAMLLHLLTGASARGVEIQPHLVALGNSAVQRLMLSRVTLQHGDACDDAALPNGDVYFMYCPFDAARVKQVMSLLERRARDRQLLVACLQVNVPVCAWLRPLANGDADLRLYGSVKPAA